MLAFVYEGTGNLSLKQVAEPKHTAKSAIIKVRASSICGTDLRTYRFGASGIIPPRIIGHEVVGTIVSIGSEVKGFSEGERVQIAPAIGCAKCRPCQKGRTNLCDSLKTIGFQFDGTFAEYMEIPQEAFALGNVSKVDPSIPDTEAVLAEPIACVVNAQEYLQIRNEDTVAIFGSGFIGCMHAVLALQKGAAHVLMIELNERRRATAKGIVPALETIDTTKKTAVEAVMEMTNGNGADVVITACSSGDAQHDAMSIAAKAGRVSLFGGLPSGKPSSGYIDSNLIHYREISVHGVHASTPEQNRKVLSLITSGKISVKPFAKNTFPLERINDAFKELNEERIIKAIIVPGV
jgi:L-iditol 2-dehydrogenase